MRSFWPWPSLPTTSTRGRKLAIASRAIRGSPFETCRSHSQTAKCISCNGEQAAKEYEIAWRADFERVAHQRDELAEGLRTRYPALATELMSLLDRIPAIDKEIGHLNAHAPPGVRDCLRGVEQTARGVEGFAPSGWPNGLLSLVTDMKLPKFETDGDRYQFSWPRPQPSSG